MRIVHFLASTGHGGDALATLALAKGQLMLGYEAQIAICGGPTSKSFCERARAEGVEATDLTTLPNETTSGFLSRAACFRRAVAPRELDVLHMHTGTLASRASDVFGARLVPSRARVLTAHSPFRWPDRSNGVRLRWRFVSRLFDHLITPSQSSRVEQLRAGVPSRRVTSLPNAVDVEKYDHGRRNATRAEFGFGADDPVILFLARLENQKRPLDALAVFREAARRLPALRMLMVGIGDLETACRRFLAEARLTDAVVMTGYRTDVPDLMRAADVYLLPTEAESFGLTVVEAMAAGTPVITSRISPLVDEIVPQDCAVFANVGDIRGFTDAVVNLFESAQRRNALSTRARAEVRARYALDIVARQHVELYRRVGSGGA